MFCCQERKSSDVQASDRYVGCQQHSRGSLVPQECAISITLAPFTNNLNYLLIFLSNLHTRIILVCVFMSF